MYNKYFESILEEAFLAGYEDAEKDIIFYNENEGIMRKRLPNHPSKIDPNNPNDERDLHQKAPIMRKKLKKLKL